MRLTCLWTCLLVVNMCLGVMNAAIISQSSLARCDVGDESEPSSGNGQTCSKKMVVSMVLKGGQGPTESLYANIDSTYQEGDQAMSKLKKPFRLEMQKSEVLASYRAYYRGSANARPTEVTIWKKKCRDGWYVPASHLPCGKQLDTNGEEVWDSQGFCCRCESLNKGRNTRGGFKCGVLGFFGSSGSAHCMKMNELWYDIFELEQPMMQYNISLTVMEFNGIVDDAKTNSKYVNWTTVSTFNLNPSQTLSKSPSGEVVAEVQGDLMGSQGVGDFSYKYLLIPSILRWSNDTLPVQYTNGPGDWLLVDQHHVDLSGTECNKVGVYYTGFRRQLGKCEQQRQSCFTNQPLDFWEHDDKLRNQSKTGFYMVRNFGKVHNSSHPNNKSFILKFIHEDLHNTFVTFKIDASNIFFVHNVGKGRIVDTHATNFEALTGVGEITVEVQNVGDITAEFSVSVLKCNRDIHRIPAKSVTIDPGRVANITFKVASFNSRTGNTDHKCEVQLYDSQFALVQTAKVDFKVNSTCFCFGTCGCTCESETGKVLCPDPPPIIVQGGPIMVRVLLLIMESIGAEGVVGFIGGLILILGFIKLSFGGVICCRKTKAQEYADRQRERGAVAKGPQLVRCSGECSGAKAAQARHKRQVERLKRLGKSPHRLDDWINSSFVCNCNSELVDIRFVHVIKAACFFYYCLLLPFILLGKKLYWSVFRDTADKKERAEKAVLFAAEKKGNLEKYGVIDLAAELKKFEEEVEGSEKKDKGTAREKANDHTLGMAVNQLRTKKAKIETRGVGNKLIGTELGLPQKQTGRVDTTGVPLSGRERNTEVNIAVIVLEERQGQSEDRKYQEKRQRSTKAKRHKRRRKRPSHEKKRKSKRERQHKASSSSDSLDKTPESLSLESAECPSDRATHSSSTEPLESGEHSHSTEYSGPESSAHHSGDYKSHDSHEEHASHEEDDAPSSDHWSEESNLESDSCGSNGESWSEGQDNSEEDSVSESHGGASDNEHSPSEHRESALEESDQMEWDYSEDDSFETYSDEVEDDSFETYSDEGSMDTENN